MEYCGPLGLPHSRFLSWREEDQDKAIAWQEYNRAKCPSCGTFPEDWLDEDGRQTIPPPYEAETVRCYGCVEIERAQEMVGDKAKGIYYYLRPWTGESEFIDGP